MALGHGYWVNGRTGGEIEISEHLDAVFSDPARFGLNPDDPMLKKGRTPDARKEILTDVIRRGWIRVRTYKNKYTFETWRINDDVLYSILEFAQRHKIWPDEHLDIHEVGRAGGGMWITVGELQQKFRPALVGETLEYRRSCPVVSLRFEPATKDVLQIISESLDRLNSCGSTYVIKEGNQFLLEAACWSAEDGYHDSPEAIIALMQAECALIESKLAHSCPVARLSSMEVSRRQDG